MRVYFSLYATDRLTGLTDPGLNHTTFAYDALNQQTAMTDPLSHTATYAYDAAGRLTGTTNRDGMRQAYSYDLAGHLTGKTRYAVGGSVQDVLTFAYDAAGNQTGAADGAGAYTLTYDAANQVTHVAEPFGLGLTMAYDAAGNRTRVQDNFGGVLTSVYDTANRLTSRQFNDGSGAVLRFDTAYTVRNQISSLTRFSNLAGTTQVGLSSYTYDAVGRETVLQHFSGSASVFQTTTYTYDLAGRMTAEKLNGTTTSYSYDAANQLTAAGSATYAYDAAGNRTSGGASPSAGDQISQDANWTYSYDADGNRTGKTSKADGSYWQYDYNAADQLTAARDFDSGGDLTAAVTYLYDAWGNLIERDEYLVPTIIIGDGGDDAMSEGGFGTDFVIEEDLTVTRYGQDGWKVSQDFWGQRPQTVGLENFDVWAELDATTGSNTLITRRFYGDGIDTPTARISYATGSAVEAWYFQDVRGSVTAVANVSGTVKATIKYDAYGTGTIDFSSSDPTYVDAYQYAGRPIDATTGLINERGRWYDPATGTFTVQDPTGFAAGDYNLTRYVHNGPTDGTDPSGLQVVTNPSGGKPGETDAQRFLRQFLENQRELQKAIDQIPPAAPPPLNPPPSPDDDLATLNRRFLEQLIRMQVPVTPDFYQYKLGILRGFFGDGLGGDISFGWTLIKWTSPIGFTYQIISGNAYRKACDLADTAGRIRDKGLQLGIHGAAEILQLMDALRNGDSDALNAQLGRLSGDAKAIWQATSRAMLKLTKAALKLTPEQLGRIHGFIVYQVLLAVGTMGIADAVEAGRLADLAKNLKSLEKLEIISNDPELLKAVKGALEEIEGALKGGYPSGQAQVGAATVQRALAERIADFRANPQSWERVAASVEQATARNARGGLSIESVYRNTCTGETIHVHDVVRPSGVSIPNHPTFRDYGKGGN